MTGASPEDRVRRAMEEMIANGAIFYPRDSVAGRTFTYEIAPGGDRQRCRRIIAEMKADATSWSAFVVEARRAAAEGA